MKTTDATAEGRDALSGWRAFGVGTLVILAQVVRIAVFAVLAVCAPLVRCVLSLASVSLLLLCVFYGLLAPQVKFPQGIVLGIAVGCAVTLMAYEMVLRALEA